MTSLNRRLTKMESLAPRHVPVWEMSTGALERIVRRSLGLSDDQDLTVEMLEKIVAEAHCMPHAVEPE